MNRNTQDALAYAGLAGFVGASLLPDLNVLGTLGTRFGAGLYSALGAVAWALPLWLVDESAGAWTGRPGATWRRLRSLGGILLAVVGLGLGGLGGTLGGRLADVLTGAIGFAAHLLVLGAAVWFVRRTLGGERVERVATDLRRHVSVTWNRADAQLERSRIARAIDATAGEVVTFGAARVVPPPLSRRPVAQPSVVELGDADEASPPPSAPRTRPRCWKLPRVCLLAEPELRSTAADSDERKRVGREIEMLLYTHGANVSTVASVRGPMVDLFEVSPLPGQALAPIRKLGPELEMQHAGLRIVPMPGTGRIGIEIPRPERERSSIALRELLESSAWRRSNAALPLALGLSSVGDPVIVDLATCPHLLVAGATGSGKSCGLNVMLTSLLLSRSPSELRLALIDPKVVELARYRDLPHLLAPPATETQDAIEILEWACAEMDRRYSVFAARGVTDIATYNALGGEQLPRIVLAVDEYADLSSVARKDVEGPVTRIAQKARAAGMHVILATQRPSVDVVTGIIKANFPSRIAFKVSQRVDSQTILDRGGAESLLGRGDSLCLLPALGTDLQRVHSAFVSSDDVRIATDAWRAQGRPECVALAGLEDNQPTHLPTYPPGPETPLNSLETAGQVGRQVGGQVGGSPDDELYDRACDVCSDAGYASAASLRSKLGVGYNAAKRMLDRMGADGLLGAADARGARKWAGPT